MIIRGGKMAIRLDFHHLDHVLKDPGEIIVIVLGEIDHFRAVLLLEELDLQPEGFGVAHPGQVQNLQVFLRDVFAEKLLIFRRTFVENRVKLWPE